MDSKALQLISRFAMSPNQLGYCGRGTAGAKFKNCIKNGKCEGVAEEIEKFIVLNPYLETIAKLLKRKKYSMEVAKTYIFGGKVFEKGYEILLKNFKKQGVPNWLIADLKKHPPKKFIPTHLFQVLHVGVGRASGSVPYNLETINNCMFRWGKIFKIQDSRFKIQIYYLNSNFKLRTREESFRNNLMVKGVKVGDTVAVHWQMPVKILTPEEVSDLKYWTSMVLKEVSPRLS